MKLAVSHFKGYYDIVLMTAPDKGTFYKKFGFNEIYGMHIRDFTYGKSSTNRYMKFQTLPLEVKKYE